MVEARDSSAADRRPNALMVDYHPLYMAPRWLYGNLFFEALRARIPTARLRYEDLVRVPWEQVGLALTRCGATPDASVLATPANGTVELGSLHTIGGNPMRFERGEIAVHEDDEWKRKMPMSARREVTAITWPLLLHYGYFTSRADAAP